MNRDDPSVGFQAVANVVPLWGDKWTDRTQVAADFSAFLEGVERMRQSFAAMARAMDASMGRMAGQQALARKRREWDAQHARAVGGHGDAVLYLLRNPRP